MVKSYTLPDGTKITPQEVIEKAGISQGQLNSLEMYASMQVLSSSHETVGTLPKIADFLAKASKPAIAYGIIGTLALLVMPDSMRESIGGYVSTTTTLSTGALGALSAVAATLIGTTSSRINEIMKQTMGAAVGTKIQAIIDGKERPPEEVPTIRLR